MKPSRIVFLPTWNEAGNIGRLLEKIVAQKIESLSVIVVDDSSPDGTGEIVKEFSKKHPNVSLHTRAGVRGRGTAGVKGFELAFEMGGTEIVEMDADFSHPPEDLPKLFEGLRAADIVVASRLCAGAVDTRPFKRRFITMLANVYARFFMEAKIHKSRLLDWTTGYRAYRRVVFEKVPPATLISQGPSIVQELLYRALNAGCTAVEVPFAMIDRLEGKSSFTPKVALQSLRAIPEIRSRFRS